MRYDQFKIKIDEETLDEVKMSPSSLKQWTRSPEAEGMLMGIEFEMCVPDAYIESDPEFERDDDADERATSIDEIVDFFSSGEFSNLTPSGARELRNEMYEQFSDWSYEKASEEVTDSLEFHERMKEHITDQFDVEDFLDDAKADIKADKSDDDDPDYEPEDEDEIYEKAKQLLDDKVDEIMMTDHGNRVYREAYDDIFNDMVDDYRNSAGYEEDDWLEDIGIRWMSDAEREYTLDWPHYYNSNEDMGDGADVDRVGNDFAVALGLDEINTSNDYHGARRDGVNWIAEPDSSIDADRGDAGIEFVSPPMPIKDGMEMISKVYEWAKEYGCYTNDSTGLHMNISVPDFSLEKLDYVKLALFMGDQYILEKFGRSYNTYTKSAMEIIKQRATAEISAQLLNKMKGHINAEATKIVHDGLTHKYTSINTKSGYVEFRGPGGDYLDKDPFEIINTALRLAMSLRIATDPTAYKQEYAKKLYKLVAPESTGASTVDKTVELFSRYAVGEIDKSELLSVLRQDRERRKEKKLGPKTMWWVSNKDGQGGKQLVFARSEQEAVITGGSNMGMGEEESLATLQATTHDEADTVLTSLPVEWQHFVNNIASSGDANLQTNLDRIAQSATEVSRLSLDQKDYIVQAIRAEQNRRRAANPQDADSAIAQQAELVNRDDPVSSNDPEADLSSPDDEDINDLMGGEEEFEIRNPHTNSVISIVRQGTLDYAIQKAREHEQDLGLEAGTLQVTRINESINTLRRLAGLIQ